MALIHISAKSLCALSGLKPNQVEPTLTALGIPLEGQEGDDLSLEITPNRPDWLSVEGVARSCWSWRTGKPKLYRALPPKAHFMVEESVRDVRPALGSAIVRGVQLDEEFLASLIQLQEKLHDTLGRGRRKMAIGLHDLAPIRAPFTYKAVGRDEVRFVPLGHSAPMTPGQILLEHEKGRAYAHLVGEKCPLIADQGGEVLSFPPIINGERTRVGLSSHDLLIDCTGTSEEAVRVVVNILCAALADRGGQVEEVYINKKPYPVFKPQIQPLPLKEANKLLGLSLDAPALIKHLARLGHSATSKQVFSPAFRADLLGAADLIEDIAISIGYNNLPMPLPPFGSVGASAQQDGPLHEAALGLGYFEVMSWILTNQSALAKSEAPGTALRVSNPLTEEFTTLRPWLYPNLLDILARSKSQPLPIVLYECGPVLRADSADVEVSDASAPAGPARAPSDNPLAPAPLLPEASAFSQSSHFAAMAMSPKACFSQSASHLQALASALGVPIELKEADLPGFIPGRAARVLVSGRPVGVIGEIHPRVLAAFGLEQPVALFELESAPLLEAGPDSSKN